MNGTICMAEDSYRIQTETEINSEMDLVRAAQKNAREFAPLYQRYYRKILAFVYHRIESKDEAFDITAQVFYKTLENLSKYEDRGLPFSAWLFRIASNELNARFKKETSVRMVSIDDEGLEELKMNVDEHSSKESDRQLYAALAMLDPDEVELIDMRFFEKRPFREIAEILGIRESACKLRVYRIAEKLKHILTKQGHEVHK
ncbi:MAG: RNA polymerase sigma factor [Bacteroidia bacterium]